MHAISLTFVCTAYSKALSALCGFELSTACGNGSKSALDTTLCSRMVAMVRQDGHRKGERNILEMEIKESCAGSYDLCLMWWFRAFAAALFSSSLERAASASGGCISGSQQFVKYLGLCSWSLVCLAFYHAREKSDWQNASKCLTLVK